MYSSNARTAALLAGLLLTLPATFARANDGTPPELFALMQQGQDVEVTLEIVGSGEPGLGEEYDLVRDGSGGEVDLLVGEQLQAESAVSSEVRCRGGWDDSEACADNPDECLDCDDDGVPECPLEYDGWCETVYYFEVVDYCVPAGETTYTFAADGWAFEDSLSIDVVDSGEECTVPGGGDGDGCSVVGLGRSGPGVGPALIILVVGLALLRSSPRTRR